MVTETIVGAITGAVFSYLLKQAKVGEQVRRKLKLDADQPAFKRALRKAFEELDAYHPEWEANLFDASFFEREGAPILAQFLIRDGHPDLHDSRALERLAEDVSAMRHRLGADQATPGTRRDYLHWLIERNLYLDPRGAFQTQRQVQVKLDEVYISLRAQREETPRAVDRRLLERELAELEARLADADLPGEEVEDQREQLLARFEGLRLDAAEGRPGEVVELAQAVDRHDRLVVLGDPGSGKTTLLRYLALKHAQALWDGRAEAGDGLGPARFPILIRIADYAENGVWKERPLSDFLAEHCAMHECPSAGLADLLQGELTGGHCLVLLDGLDEIVDADDRRGVVGRIEDFVRRHDDRPNRFVVTSRSAGYRSAPLGAPFARYTVQEMDEAQIRRFLERWCAAVEMAQTPDLSPEARQATVQREIEGIVRAVEGSPGVRRLAANPLMLRTLALIHRTGAQLPQRRVELYKLPADTLARTWRPAMGVPESALVEERYLTRLLGRMAYWLHFHKPTGIATEREVYAILGEDWARINRLHWDEDYPDPAILNEVEEFLKAVREHTGLFVERAPKRYGFMHLTFEEYYAARHLVARRRNAAPMIRRHLHDSRWEEPILLALGFVGLDYPEEAAELLETAVLAEGGEAEELNLAPSLYEELLGRDYLFALRCLGDQIPADPRLVRRLSQRLAGELAHRTGSARFWRYRRTLKERLAYLAGSDAVAELTPPLVAALGDENVEVRYLAAQSLGQLGQASPEVVSALVAALGDENVEVRYLAAQSLGQLGQASPEVVAALIESLRHADSWSARRDAARLLGENGTAEKPLVVALWRGLLDEDDDVRTACAEALARLGRRFPDAAETIAEQLVQAIKDPAFEGPDKYQGRTGHDYAFDGLWLLVAGGAPEGG